MLSGYNPRQATGDTARGPFAAEVCGMTTEEIQSGVEALPVSAWLAFATALTKHMEAGQVDSAQPPEVLSF